MRLVKVVLVGLAIIGLTTVLAIGGLFFMANKSVERARSGAKAVEAAALQNSSGDDLVSMAEKFGLNIHFVESENSKVISSGLITSYAPNPLDKILSREKKHEILIGNRSGTLTVWGGFIFARWFCEVTLEHGHLKPKTIPKVFYLD